VWNLSLTIQKYVVKIRSNTVTPIFILDLKNATIKSSFCLTVALNMYYVFKLLKTNKETLVQMPLFCAIFYETNYNFSTNIEIFKSHSLQR
jgi:hypothetical protein